MKHKINHQSISEFDVYEWIQYRFSVSALLASIPLVTNGNPELNSGTYIMIDIFDKGGMCFDVQFSIHSPYQGQLELIVLKNELKTCMEFAANMDDEDGFANDKRFVWREIRKSGSKAGATLLCFKGKAFS